MKPEPPDVRGHVIGSTTTKPPSAAAIADLQRTVLDWYAGNGRELPWRRTLDPYAILVSEIMLQQTQVSRVLPRYLAFLERFPDLETLSASTLTDVLAEWSGLGYNNRAERLRRCAQAVTATAAGPARLPQTYPELVALPGLGPYTARAVLIFAHNADLAAVDANVRRVLTHELRLPHDLPPAALQEVADAALPNGRSRDWHNGLMDYGALVLTGRVTGIAARTRQAPFAGSRRWWRSRIVRSLLDHGPADATSLRLALDIDAGQLDELLDLLEKDGIVERRDGLVRLP
jgi:A/G-specific adenine glycosylase